MQRPLPPVSLRVKASLALALFLSAPLMAVDVDPQLDRAVRALLPVCPGAKVTYASATGVTLPARFSAKTVGIESERPACGGQMLAVLSPAGGIFLGSPWPIADEAGDSVEQKVQSFALRNLRETVDVVVDRTPDADGLWPARVIQPSEAGKRPMFGRVDPAGRVFFFGTFRRIKDDLPSQRLAALGPALTNAPAKGPSSAAVTVVEFSDFQCPSCRRSNGYADMILKAHGNKVRYVRYDVPLSGHPWAFPAALAGRAIYRQNPGLFWEYKKTIYDNQDKLNAFTFWDWARAWAEDHELDLARYDADLTNAPLRAEILEGAGRAFANDVRATPTFMVNGTIVDAGENGKDLAEYVAGLMKN